MKKVIRGLDPGTLYRRPGSVREFIGRASAQSAAARALGRLLADSLQQCRIAQILIDNLLKQIAVGKAGQRIMVRKAASLCLPVRRVREFMLQPGVVLQEIVDQYLCDPALLQAIGQ